MRQRRALVVARRLIEIEAKALACRQHRFAVLQLADAQLGPLHIGEDADRPLQLVLDRADGLLALSMIVVRAVAVVEADHIGAGAYKMADHLLAGAGGAERGEALRFSLASQCPQRTRDSTPAGSMFFASAEHTSAPHST